MRDPDCKASTQVELLEQLRALLNIQDDCDDITLLKRAVAYIEIKVNEDE